MRALLSVKWKLIIAVVAISFICLFGLTVLNRRQAEQYTLERSRELAQEATSLEAFRYNQMAENFNSALSAINASINSELDYGEEKGTPPDADRIAAFARSAVDSSSSYMTALGVILFPEVIPDLPESSRFRNLDGYTVIKFSRSRGVAKQEDPERQDAIFMKPWFTEVATTGKGFIDEPYFDMHEPTAGQRVRHVEACFVQPAMRDGRLLGVIWAEMCLTDLQQRLYADAMGGHYHRALLVSPDGTVVGDPGDLDISSVIDSTSDGLPKLRTDKFPEIMDTLAVNKRFHETLTLSGRKVFVSSTPISRQDITRFWSVLMFSPEDHALFIYRENLTRQAYLALFMLVLSALLGYLAANILGKTLATTEQWHRTILDRVTLPLGLMDQNSYWVYVNPTLAEIMAKYNHGEPMAGRPIAQTLSAKDSAFLKETNRPEAPAIVEMDTLADNGRYYHIRSYRLLAPDGEYVGRLALGVDVTDNREMENTIVLASKIAASLDSRSEKILKAAQTLSDAALEKSAAIEEITSTTQRIGESAAIYANSARNSHSQAESTHGASDRGTTEALQAAVAMNGVRDSGHKIRQIIKLIDDIAFQTNLLALNAAVEAARAGRHGKGFAVVADEVRNLAQRSARAAKETSTMIGEMSDRIGQATDSIEQLSGTLIEIKENAENLRANSDEVARLAEAQSTSVQQVHVSLEQISKSVDSTIGISQETASIAGSIFRQAAALRDLTHGGKPGGQEGGEPGSGAGAPEARIQLAPDERRRLLPLNHKERS